MSAPAMQRKGAKGVEIASSVLREAFDRPPVPASRHVRSQSSLIALCERGFADCP